METGWWIDRTALFVGGPVQKNKDAIAVILALLGLGGVILFFKVYGDDVRVPSRADLAEQQALDPLRRGKKAARGCTPCHDLTSVGRTNRVGPPLWGIVGKKSATIPNYKYSKAHIKASTDLVWNEENLSQYLKNPKVFIPGNKMAYAGIKVDEERRALIDYLKTLQNREEKPVRPLLDPKADALFPTTVGKTSRAAVKMGAIEGEKCGACHDRTKKKKNIVGPYLWEIVGRPAGGVVRYSYSKAFKKKIAGGLIWNTQNLDAFLQDPKGFIPGSKMLFDGIKDDKRRANLIRYLKTLK